MSGNGYAIPSFEKPRRGKRTGCAWRIDVCRRCLCKNEENEDRSPKGANMAGAIFGGILVLEGQDCYSDYLGNYFSDYA